MTEMIPEPPSPPDGQDPYGHERPEVDKHPDDWPPFDDEATT